MALQRWQRRIRAMIDVMAADPGDIPGMTGGLDDTLSAGVEQNFYDQRDDTGAAWAPRVDNEPHPLLRKTGGMFQAATNPSDAAHVFEAKGEGVFSLTIDQGLVPYWIYHHFGTVKMPSRRFLYASEDTQRELLRVVERNYSKELLRRGVLPSIRW